MTSPCHTNVAYGDNLRKGEKHCRKTSWCLFRMIRLHTVLDLELPTRQDECNRFGYTVPVSNAQLRY